ncbi:ATP-binding cassette domain-containing protein [Streptomyces sp. NPDC046821]|uniref:ATP-binding cassette domain-containing protein n=1 Tax=Streptomyces sp. NPDC046821 TaxID=3154702 RepID=UPI0033EC4632
MIQAFGLTSNPRQELPPAVDDVSFEAPTGRVTALLGARASGTTTAVRLMLELQHGRGITYFRGRPLHRIPCPSREVGVLLGEVQGHPSRTVRGHLRMLCAAAGEPVRRADEVLEAVGIVSLRDQRLGTLSRGMDRRLGLACALLADPHTLVLDGPADGLSAREGKWLHGILRAHASLGGTVLFTTDDAKEAARTADRVVTLDQGRLVADQDVADFARTRLRPRVVVRSPYAARLGILLAKEARAKQRSVEVVNEGGNRLSVYGSNCADIGETAFRHNILVHQLADEVGDAGPAMSIPVRTELAAGANPSRAELTSTEAARAERSLELPVSAEAAVTQEVSTQQSALAELPSPPITGSAELPSPAAERAEPPAPAPTPAELPSPIPTSAELPSPIPTSAELPSPIPASAELPAPAAAPAELPAPAATRAPATTSRELPAPATTPTAPPTPSAALAESPAHTTPSAQESTFTQEDTLPIPRTFVPLLADADLGPAASRTATPRLGQLTRKALAPSPGRGTSATGTHPPVTTAPAVPVPAPLSPLPPPITIRPACSPLRPLRYEIRRATGIATGYLTAATVLAVSAVLAVLLARAGHTGQSRLLVAWPQALPLPPAALGAGLLGAFAFGDEFRHPALAADGGTVPRRLGLLCAKLVVATATALSLAFAVVASDAMLLHLVYGEVLIEVPADWLSSSVSWFALVVGCAWAGVLASGVFRSTTAGLAAVLAVPIIVVPLVQKAMTGPSVRTAAGLPARLRDLALVHWPFGGERFLMAGLRMIVQPVGSALMLSVTALLCAYLVTVLRPRVR